MINIDELMDLEVYTLFLDKPRFDKPYFHKSSSKAPAKLAAPVGQGPHDPTALSRRPAKESYCSAQAPDANSMESRWAGDLT